jgi:hypothetical protein
MELFDDVSRGTGLTGANRSDARQPAEVTSAIPVLATRKKVRRRISSDMVNKLAPEGNLRPESPQPLVESTCQGVSALY